MFYYLAGLGMLLLAPAIWMVCWGLSARSYQQISLKSPVKFADREKFSHASAIIQTVLDMPPKKPLPGKSLGITVTTFLAMGVTVIFLAADHSKFLFQLSMDIIFASPLILFIYMTMMMLLEWGIRISYSTKEEHPPVRLLLLNMMVIATGCLGGVIAIIGGLLFVESFSHLEGTLSGIIAFILILLYAPASLSMIALLPGLVIAAPLLNIHRSLARGDYQATLTKIEKNGWLPELEKLHYQGLVRLLMGDLEKTRQIQRDYLIRVQQTPAPRTPTWNDSALMWLQQGEYEKARAILNATLLLEPENSTAHNLMAEIILREGKDPAEVLAEADMALEYRKTDFFLSRFDRHAIAEIQINRAWALALLKRHTDSQTALEEAFQVFKKTPYIPAEADVNYRAGLMIAALGNHNRARLYWQEALRLDPDGLYGKLAKQQLNG